MEMLRGSDGWPSRNNNIELLEQLDWLLESNFRISWLRVFSHSFDNADLTVPGC